MTARCCVPLDFEVDSSLEVGSYHALQIFDFEQQEGHWGMLDPENLKQAEGYVEPLVVSQVVVSQVVPLVGWLPRVLVGVEARLEVPVDGVVRRGRQFHHWKN